MHLPKAGVAATTEPRRLRPSTISHYQSGTSTPENQAGRRGLAVGTLQPPFWAKRKTLLKVEVGTYDEMKAIFVTRSAQHWEAGVLDDCLPIAVVKPCPRG